MHYLWQNLRSRIGKVYFLKALGVSANLTDFYVLTDHAWPLLLWRKYLFRYSMLTPVKTSFPTCSSPPLPDTIVDKYTHLSKAVTDRNEKLQITLTRSLSVQDGLDEMLDWMNGVEKSLEEQGQVPLNSAAIQDVISKSMVSIVLMAE